MFSNVRFVFFHLNNLNVNVLLYFTLQIYMLFLEITKTFISILLLVFYTFWGHLLLKV